MLAQLKKITKSTAIYSVGQIAPKLVGLILLPFLLDEKYLSASDYGRLSMLEASSLMFITLFGFGLNYALERWYWDPAYIKKRKSVVFTILCATIVITSLIWLLLSFFTKDISMFLVGREDWDKLISLLFICSALESIILIPNTLLRLEEKPLYFVLTNIVRFVLYLGFTVYFLISLKHGLEGIFEARMISLFAVLLILSSTIIRNISFQFDFRTLKDMLLFRLPLVLSSISYIIFNITDRFSLRILSDDSFKDVGVYSLGYTITNSVKVVVLSAIWLSVRPMIYKMMHQDGNRRFYSKLMKYMIFGVTFLLLSITVFGQEVISIFTRNDIYGISYLIIPIISLAIIFDTLKEISQSIGLNILKKTGVIAIMTIVTTVLNIGLNILLIPKLNIYGAALSTAISQFCFFFVVYRYAQKKYPIPYEIKRIATMIVVFIILSGMSVFLSNWNLLFRIAAKLTILAAFPIVLFYLHFYEDIEVTRIRELWNKIKKPSEWLKIISRV